MKRMLVLSLAVALAQTTGLWADGGNDTAAYTFIKSDDRAELERGEWRVVRIISRGDDLISKQILQQREMRMVFKGNKLTLKFDGTDTESTFKLNSNGRPKQLDWNVNPAINQGIYQLDNDDLKIALGPKRPREFAGKGNTAVYFLKRVKP